MGLFGFLADIASAIWDGIKAIWNACKKIVKAVIDFVRDLVNGLFDILVDIFGEDNIPDDVNNSPAKPFIADMDKLIQSAPTKDVGLFQSKKKNYLTGVYDTRTGEIKSPTYVAGDSVDSRTKDEMGDEPIIVVG